MTCSGVIGVPACLFVFSSSESAGMKCVSGGIGELGVRVEHHPQEGRAGAVDADDERHRLWLIGELLCAPLLPSLIRFLLRRLRIRDRVGHRLSLLIVDGFITELVQ